MICKKSAKYCREWAKDFRRTGNLPEAGFWEAVAVAFGTGANVVGNGLEHAIDEIKIQLDCHNLVMSMAESDRDKKALTKIYQEKSFVLPRLEAMYQKHTEY